MRWTNQLGVVALSMVLSVTAFAQDQNHNGGHGGGHGNGGGNNSGHNPGPGNVNKGSTSKQPGRFGTGPSSVYVNPFQQQIHLKTAGQGCYNCGYSTYGGYVYSGYENNGPAAGNTATDRILANGGTFNNINESQFEQTQNTQPQSQQPIYVRPEYPAQYSPIDNSYVNSPTTAPIASATSESPAILVFKDGTQLKITNYAIYGANIVVLTPERKKFSISDLDVRATEKANSAAGYELKLPAVFTSH